MNTTDMQGVAALPRKPAGAAFFGVLLVAFWAGCTGTIDATPSTGPASDEANPGAPAVPGGPSSADPQGNPAAPIPDPSGTPPPAAGSAAASGVTVRRLDRAAYTRTVKDLLGLDLPASVALPPDESAFFFENNAEALTLSPARAEQYAAAAEALASKAMSTPGKLLACATKPDDACARRFVREVGQRAFRRPLSDAEAAPYDRLYDQVKGESGPARGLELALRGLLLAPQFLFRVEEGEPAPDRPSGRRLTSWEMASRLSYFLLGSMPDAPLLAAAAAGKLSSDAEVKGQAERLAADPRAREAVAGFFRQWLRLDDLALIDKSRTQFPTFDATLPGLFRREIEGFLDQAVWGDEGTLATLFTSARTSLNRPLAKFYGVTGPAGDAFVPASHDPARRGGVLTLAGLMATLAGALDGSPTLRGAFVRRRILCGDLPPPPNDVNMQRPPPSKTTTTRERTQEHTTAPACAGCHRLIDPIGFAFERFDGLGQYRDDEGERPIDDQGEVIGTSLGTVKGALELGTKLAASPEAAACLAKALFRYALGRVEDPGDAAALDRLARAAAERDAGALRRLLVAVTASEPFTRPPATPAPTAGGAR